MDVYINTYCTCTCDLETTRAYHVVSWDYFQWVVQNFDEFRGRGSLGFVGEAQEELGERETERNVTEDTVLEVWGETERAYVVH